MSAGSTPSYGFAHFQERTSFSPAPLSTPPIEGTAPETRDSAVDQQSVEAGTQSKSKPNGADAVDRKAGSDTGSSDEVDGKLRPAEVTPDSVEGGLQTDPPIPAFNPTTSSSSATSTRADSPATGGFALWASPSTESLPARPRPTRFPPPAPLPQVSGRWGSFPLPAKPAPPGGRPSTTASAPSTRPSQPPSGLPPVLPPVPSVQVKLTLADMMGNVVTTEPRRWPVKRGPPARSVEEESKRQKVVNGIKDAFPIACPLPPPPSQTTSSLMVDQSTQTDAVWHFSAPREPYPPGEGFAEALEALEKLAKRREGA